MSLAETNWGSWKTYGNLLRSEYFLLFLVFEGKSSMIFLSATKMSDGPHRELILQNSDMLKTICLIKWNAELAESKP